MLAPIKSILATKRIVLASGSPRRQELVKTIGLNAELYPSTFEENLNPKDYEQFSDFVELTAQGKAEEVYNRLKSESPECDLLVIAADTMVTMGNTIYGKPDSPEHAVKMLSSLSGNCNTPHTGVVIKHSKGLVRFTESAKVYFGQLTNEQIEAYVESGEPLDKAGAYGINGLGGAMIEKIEGDYYTVMGLPLYRLTVEMCKMFSSRASCSERDHSSPDITDRPNKRVFPSPKRDRFSIKEDGAVFFPLRPPYAYSMIDVVIRMLNY